MCGMKLFFVLISFIVLVSQITLFLHAKKKGFVAKLHWEKYRPCGDIKNVKAQLQNVEFGGDLKTESVINLDLITGDDIPKRVLAVATVMKCAMIDDKNCEHYVRVEADFCDILRNRKGQFYEAALNFKPPLVCPIKSNQKFTIRNATLDLQRLISFAGGLATEYQTHYWNYKIILKDGDRKPHKSVMCFNFMYKIYIFKA